MAELIQQQTPDYVGSILKGYQFGQQAKANQLQLLASQQEMDINKYKLAQAEAENILSKTASMGDVNALRQLAAYNPTRAEGIRKQQDYSDIQGARILDSYASMPQYAFSQKKWEQMHNEYFEATGKELPLPSEKSPEAILEFKRFSSRLKGREQDLKEQYQAAQIKTEGLQQGKIVADTKGVNLDNLRKTGEFLDVEQERALARDQGITLATLRDQQQKIGQFRGEQISKLPQIEQNIQTTTKLVDDLLKHKGFKDVVGATYKPFARKIAGTDAAGFMAKYNQLKGKQFLESISQLQGYGALSNLEGTTATNAASAMDISTNETEFKRNAREYQRVIKIGLERMKNGVGYNGQRMQMQNATPESESNIIDWGSL